MLYRSLGATGIDIPPIIFGTSCLGNLYHALPWATKLAILREIFHHIEGTVVLDTAGKYGAGLALEVIGDGLRALEIPPERIIISNKLGWYRVPLTTPEPTFEPGAWADLQNDAVQKISYDGILACWEQGNRLLGERCKPQLLSVHDPDEYLAAAKTPHDRQKALRDIMAAYRALAELKEQGLCRAIGVGAKDWRVIRAICAEIDLDWVMLALSFTILRHPPELLDFLDELTEKGIGIINSAVFHAGFLTGGAYFDYRILNPENSADQVQFAWRDEFFQLCQKFNVAPADACVRFGLSYSGVLGIALNTGNPSRILPNIQSVSAPVPVDFWRVMLAQGLIRHDERLDLFS